MVTDVTGTWDVKHGFDFSSPPPTKKGHLKIEVFWECYPGMWEVTVASKIVAPSSSGLKNSRTVVCNCLQVDMA
jgi:hypothetical protein